MNDETKEIEKNFEMWVQELSDALKINQREELIDFLCVKESREKANEAYKILKERDISKEVDKPSFDELLDYVLDIKEESSFGEEAHNLFDKHSKDLLEKTIQSFPEQEILSGEQDPFSHEMLKSVAQIYGLSSKRSVATLSNSHISVRQLMEVLSEEVVGCINRRENLDFIDDPKPYLETALLNPRMPRQVLAKAIQALMAKEWQIKMLRKFGESLNAKPEDIELAISVITKDVKSDADVLKRPLVEKKGPKVSLIKRMKDQLNK